MIDHEFNGASGISYNYSKPTSNINNVLMVRRKNNLM